MFFKSKSKKQMSAVAEAQPVSFAEGVFDEDASMWKFEDSGQTFSAFGFRFSSTRRVPDYPDLRRLEAVSRGLPPESVIQFAVHVDTGISREAMDAWETGRRSDEYPELSACAQSRRELLETLTRESLSEWAKTSRVRTVQHFVFVTLPTGDRKSAAVLMEGCRTRLTNMGLEPKLLTGPQYEHLARRLDYPVINARPRKVRTTGDVELEMRTRGLERAAIPVAVTYPQPTPVPIGPILEDGNPHASYTPIVTCPYWAFAVFHIKALGEMKAVLAKSHNRRYRGIFPSAGRNIIAVSEATADALKFEGFPGDRALLVSAGVVLFSRPEDAQANIERVLVSERRAGYRAEHLHVPQAPSTGYWQPFKGRWASASPAPWFAVRDYEAQCLAEFTDDADQAALAKGGVPLVTARGSLSAFNPWHSPTNYNFLLSGLQGCGKTIFARDLIASVLQEGGRVRVLDWSCEWVKKAPPTEVFRPKVVKLEDGAASSLNPFSVISTEADFWWSFQPIVELILAMGYPSCHEQDLPQHAWVLVGPAVVRAWQQRGAETTLGDVQRCLRESEVQPYGVEMADLLAPFVSGDYADWFKGPRERHESERFVVYACTTHRWCAGDYHQLHEVLSCAVTLALYQDASANTAGEKQLVYVEAPELLPGYGRGMAWGALLREGKKFNLSVGLESLDIPYLMKNYAGRVAMEQSSTLALMHQKKESLDYLLAKGELLDEQSVKLATSVSTCPEWAGIYVRNGFGHEGVYRFFADPMTMAALPGCGDAWRAINRYRLSREEGASVGEALTVVAAGDARFSEVAVQ